MKTTLSGPIENFDKITGYPLINYFLDFERFMTVYATLIEKFYNGELKLANATAFESLKKLRKDATQINDVMNSFRSYFETADYWELLMTLDNIRGKLETFAQAPKWLRSSIAKGSFSGFNLSDITQQQNQTLEQMASAVTGSLDKEQDWVQIALQNDVTEEGYTSSGGLQVQMKSEAGQLTVQSVVDVLMGDSVYGKDIKQKIEFSTADEDLVVLAPRDTVVQAVSILANLKQGDNPEYETLGVQASMIAGTNSAAFQYPSLIRQIREVVDGDDTLTSFKITKLENNANTRESNIQLEFEVNTRLGEILTESVTI